MKYHKRLLPFKVFFNIIFVFVEIYIQTRLKSVSFDADNLSSINFGEDKYSIDDES